MLEDVFAAASTCLLLLANTKQHGRRQRPSFTVFPCLPTTFIYIMAVIVLLLFPFSRLLEHVGIQECIVRACFGCLSALRDPSTPALSFGVTPLCALLSSLYQAGSPGEGRRSHERGVEEGNYPSASGFSSEICLGTWGFKFTQRKLFVSGY